jgi:hypothetical protein
MEEEVNESVNNLEVAEQEEVVENTANETETTEQVSEQVTEQVEEVGEQEEQETEKQSNEENAKYASIRRKAQEDAKKQIEQARKEAYEQGLNQGKVQSYIGRNNPYTGQAIKDEYDVQEYLDMYELDSNGKDPISGYRELQKDKARKEAEEKVKAEEQSKQEKWYQDDTKDFVEKYSAEKLQELGKDEDFNLFANGKIGKVPLAQIYEDYQKLINKYEKKSVETAKQIVANNSTTPGAIEDTEVQDLDWNSMSSEQFEKYIQKAKDGELK